MATVNRRWLLIGGIGSGKSAVREILADKGFRTIDSDSVGHRVLMPNGPAFPEVAERWPGVVRQGMIDRARLAEIVFADERQLRELEAITHPHIFDSIRASVEGFPARIWVVEMPLIGNRLGDGWAVMVVDASDEMRLSRLLARGVTESDARARMASQPTRSEWLASADVVIPNHGGLDDLQAAVDRMVVGIET